MSGFVKRIYNAFYIKRFRKAMLKSLKKLENSNFKSMIRTIMENENSKVQKNI